MSDGGRTIGGGSRYTLQIPSQKEKEDELKVECFADVSLTNNLHFNNLMLFHFLTTPPCLPAPGETQTISNSHIGSQKAKNVYWGREEMCHVRKFFLA